MEGTVHESSWEEIVPHGTSFDEMSLRGYAINYAEKGGQVWHWAYYVSPPLWCGMIALIPLALCTRC